MFISSKEENFLKISYQFEPPGNARLDFFLDNLKINLCLPYVLKIYKFAMDAIGTTNKTEIKIDSATKNRQIDSRIDQLEKDQTESSLNVYGRINLKEVVLFAQPEKLNSQILIMEAELVLKFDSINTMSNLEIDLTNLSLRLGEHNQRRQGIPFLSPCTGKISMHQIDPKKPARYLAKIDSLFFNMTQTLYEVVMGVVTSINQTGTEQVQKIADNEQLLDDAEPFVKRSIDPSNYETSSRPQDEIENQSSTIEYVKNAFNKVTEVLDLKIGGAYITFCEETPMDLQPLAIFKIQLEGQVANWSKNLHTKASLTLEASYYNDILSNWEPLVEHNMQKEDNYRPWILSIWFALEPGGTVQPSIEVKGVPTIEFPVKELDYSEIENEIQNHRAIDDNLSQEINIEEQMDENEKKRKKAGLFKRKKKTKQAYSENFEQEIVGGEIQQQPLSIDETKNASYILVESNDLLNINITPSAYKVCMYLSSITSGSQREFMEGNLKAPLKFLNFLGEECDLILNNRQSVKSENAIGFNVKYEEMNTRVHSMDNDPNKRIEKIMLSSQRSQIDMIYNENYKFTFCLANFEKCRLSMKNDGSFLFPLRIRDQLDTHSDSPLVKENIKYNVMYKVRTLYGRQKIIISSPLQIENYTQISLFVWIEMTRLLCEYKSKFNFIDQITHGDKAYVALFRLLPNKVYYVPLYIAYNCKIYVSPDNKMFAPSQIFDLRGYNLRVEDYSQVVCKSIDNQQDFNLLRKLSLNVRSHRNVMPAMHANYRVSLYTAIRLVNSLPFQIRLDIDQNEQVLFNPTMEPGDILSLNLNALNVASIRIHLLNYLNASWFGKLTLSEVIQSNTDRFRIKMNLSPTTEMLVTGKHLNICVTYKHPNEFVIYSPYWLINKSGQPIKIRTTDDLRTYSIPDDSILLFDFQQVRKDNKVRLTIKEGSWSRPFSFETVGTTGMIQCSDIHQTYNFLMRITMSNSNRTKLVTFAPFLTVANNLDEPVWIREWHGSEKKTAKHNWIRVDKTNDDNKPIGLWPKLVGESKQVKFVLKILDGRITQPFNLENPARFVLILSDNDQSFEQMNQQQQNLNVEASSKILTVLISGGNQNPVTIVVRKYQYGDAVAKFLNLCDDLHISILNNNLMWNIEPFSSMFFVWPDLDNRVLQWTVNNCSKSEVLKLTKSGTETCTFSISIEKNENSALYNSDNDHDMGAKSNLIKANQGLNKQGQRQVQVCCVSYLEDGQRCIVFTTDKSLAEFEQKKEASNLELFMSIRGIQLSIINNVNLEISTVYIRGSNSSWEIHNEDEIRVFTKEYSEWLELMYANFLFNLHSVESLKHKALLNNDNLQQAEYLNEKFHINFKKMIIYKPEPGRLVRNFHPGLIVQYRASANMTSIKCCVFNIQVDNQLPDAYFPIVLYKSPIRLIDDSQLIPYVTISIFKELQNVTEIYRYFECTIQEFYLKADKGFLLSLKDWYEAATYTSSIEDMTFDLSADNEIEAENVLILIDEDKSVQERINLDIKLSKEIMEYANKTGTIKQSAHIRFEEFYLSPMLFNMSFSMNGEAHTDDKVRSDSNAASDYLFNFFLESIGTSLTEFKDVKFSFNQFDMINETKTWTEMYDTLFDHYKVQALRQAYVLIFGLDVLGNPFGLVSDFSEGFTSIFYDPLVDYLSGRDRADKVDIEFTTKLKLALYKSVSSAAGSGSLITGTIGRVLATFSFDKKYKKKRQYKISKLSTSTLSNTVSNASKGIVQGVIYGITGLVNNPLEERKRGTKALIAGMGKGLAGFVSKPVGSVFDGVSISLDGLKRFALSGSEPITNIRLPRHLINDVSILPYSAYQAKGYEILRDLQNDNIAQEEFYWAHLFLQNKRRRSLLFITDAHIYRLKKTSTQILKQWKLLQDPIQLHKITTSTIVAFEMPQNLTSKQRKALENCLLAKSFKESDLHQFYITYKKDTENYDLNADNSKMLLLISQKSACQWLDDKIQSAIKYYKELKNYVEIV